MTTKYAPVADRILELVGGPGNVADVYHCQTRLRFSLKDESKADPAQIRELDGVASALSAGGTFQVIIGPHVKDVFEEVDKDLRSAGVDLAGDVRASVEKKPNVLSRILDFISSSFVPIIPPLAGAGLLSALLALLVTFGWVTTESQTYVVISFWANTLFFFLPIFLAFSAAGKLGINRYLAAVVAAMMVHPVWIGLVDAGEPVTLFNLIPLTLATYTSTVIPVLTVVFIQSYVEKFLERVIPNAIKIIAVPLILFLVMGTLAFSVLGPIGALINGYLTDGFQWLTDNAPWAPPLLYGALHPVLVMFGLHTAIGPVGYLQLAQFGFDSITGPGAICSNIAKGTAAIVAGLRSKDVKFRQIGLGAGFTSIMGISEPAIYGVLLPKRYPLIAAMIGGGAGGLFAGLTGARRFAGGSSGILALPMYIGDDTLRYFYSIVIALVISAAVTAVVTVVLSVRFERPAAIEQADEAELDGAVDTPVSAGAPATTSGVGPRTAGGVATLTGLTELTAPCTGTVVPLESVADAAFASGALGQGFGIEPRDGTVVAPVAGTVIAAMGTGHAYGIRTEDGLEVLVHVGIDTVTMKGQGFEAAVRQGERVSAGQLLVNADLDAIAAAHLAPTVVVVVTGSKGLGGISLLTGGEVVAGEPILSIER